MKDRIVKFLASESISPAEFADKIGVQRSSMSHILNGRNYPSASFLQKMLQVYPNLNPRWLMIGDGAMNTDSPALVLSNPIVTVTPDQPGLSDELPPITAKSVFTNEQKNETTASFPQEAFQMTIGLDPANRYMETENSQHSEAVDPHIYKIGEKSGESAKGREVPNPGAPLPFASANEKEIEQVFFFYKDKTFTVYRPS
jgi:transcriptional regulator with XRE-family HTH domain